MFVKNLVSARGNIVPNQFVIESPSETVFQSYSTVIAKIVDGELAIKKNGLDYSTTTNKYLYSFLREYSALLEQEITKKKLKAMITKGEIKTF